MFKALCVCLILFSSCSDQQKIEKQEKALVKWTGESADNLDIKLIEDFKLDSIQFTQSAYKYLLQGSVVLKKEKHTFSLLFDKHPLKTVKNKVIRWNFPLEKIDSTRFDCFFHQTEGGYFVKWINSKNKLRIFIKEELISER